jgi:ferric-dicitrate binding protein FerR (iron transport regulator)
LEVLVDQRFKLQDERDQNAAADFAELTGTLNSLVKRLEHRDREQATERKADRRWMFGAALSAASLVVAAIGVLAAIGVFQ